MRSLTETDKKKLEYLIPLYGDRIFDLVEDGLNVLDTGYNGYRPVVDLLVFCRKCGELQVIKNVDYYGYLAWRGGAIIQNALSTLSANDRELLISGFCNKCWNEIFKDDE